MKEKKQELDLMAVMATITPGGIIDENETRTLKNYTFILKGKRTLEMQAYDEDEAKAMFDADAIFSKEKVIDIIESDIVEHEPTQLMPTGGNSVLTVTELDPAKAASDFAEEFQRRIEEGKAALAAEMAAREAASKPAPKKTTRKKS